MKIKNPYIVGVAICMLTIFIYSCRKELSDKVEVVTEAQWAKDYFTQSLLPKEGNMVDGRNYLPNGLSGNLRSTKKENFKTPIWQRAKDGKTALYDFVEIPIQYTTKVMPIIYREDPDRTAPRAIDKDVLRASLDRLIIYKNKRGTINQRVVSFVPTSAYLKRHNGDISHNQINKLDKDFEGFLVYRKWDGNFLFALVIKDGKAVKKMSLRKKEMKITKTAFAKRRACETIEVYEIFINCEYANPDDYPHNPSSCGPPYEEYVGSYEVCTPDDPCLDPINFNTVECGGDEGGGGEDDEPTDCAGVVGGSATKASCGCIGGTTGVPDCSKDPCNQAKLMNYKNSTAGVNSLNGVLDASTATNPNIEYGGEYKLDGNGDYKTYTSGSGSQNSYPIQFTYDATEGYTVGFDHTHNGNGYPAPSPADIMKPYSYLTDTLVSGSGKSQMFMDNFWVGTRSSSGKYIVTVNDWSALYTLRHTYSNTNLLTQYTDAIANYSATDPGSSLAERSEHAFLTVFGSTLNMLKLNATTGKYEAFELASNGYPKKKNCP
jgi:hypothetical protein